MDAFHRRRLARRSRHRVTLYVAAGVALAALLLAGAVGAWLAVGGKGRSVVVSVAGPSPGREGDDWTHDELFAHLKARGVVDSITDRNPVAFQGPAATFAKGGEEVVAQKMATAQDARDRAGVMGGDGGFAWGRFLFAGDGKLVSAIRKELNG